VADLDPTIRPSTTQPKPQRGSGRIFQRGKIVWIAYYLRGREHRESAGTSDEKAAQRFLRHRLKEVGADLIGAKPFVNPQQQRLTINELLDALEGDFKLRGVASPQFRSQLRHVRKQFGFVRAVDLTSEMVDDFIQKRLETNAAPATINRSTQLLSQAFKLALRRKRIASAPIVRRLSEKGNARQGFFGERDFRDVMRNLPDYLQDFVLFGYLVGWRSGEIRSLKWKDVDGDVIRLRPEHSKNGEGRVIVLAGELAALFERRKASRQVKTESGGMMLTSLIFHHGGEPIVDFRKAWATACCRAGVGRFVCKKCAGAVDEKNYCARCSTTWKREELKYDGRLFHDFRRSAIRNMVRAGVPEKVAMSISGHKTRSTFDRYNIINETDVREAMQKTQNYLKEAGEEKTRVLPPKTGSDRLK
jgi:integrase